MRWIGWWRHNAAAAAGCTGESEWSTNQLAMLFGKWRTIAIEQQRMMMAWGCAVTCAPAQLSAAWRCWQTVVASRAEQHMLLELAQLVQGRSHQMGKLSLSRYWTWWKMHRQYHHKLQVLQHLISSAHTKVIEIPPEISSPECSNERSRAYSRETHGVRVGGYSHRCPKCFKVPQERFTS